MKFPLLVKEKDREKEEDDKRSEHRENPIFMINRKGDGVTLFGILIAIDHDHYINVICLRSKS